MNTEDFKKVAILLRSNDTYNVYDWHVLSKLTLSLTELHVKKNTTGHLHAQEEVYIFLMGHGIIELNGKCHPCKRGDAFTIPSGVFHKVYNIGKIDLKFWCIFENYR